MSKKRIGLIIAGIVAMCLLIIGASVGTVLLIRGRNTDRAKDGNEVKDVNSSVGSALTGDGVEIEKSDSFGKVADDNTVMIYMVGSDLESKAGAATFDIAEMMASGVDTSKTNVVIFTGGCSQWMSDISSDKNYVMRLDKSGLIEDGATSSINNMGDPNTLLGFLNFCTENYKSDHYTLIFWDHGCGPVYGYGVDELHSNDTLTYPEMEAALVASDFDSKNKIDLVGFDACLMASIEYADLFSSYADYMVASQEVEPGLGWDYSFLNTYNSTSDPKKIGTAVVDAFGDFYSSHISMMSNPLYTLSVMDLSKTNKVIEASNDLFEDMYKGLGKEDYAEIVKARDNTVNLGSTAYGSKGDAIDEVDLGSVASEFSDLYKGSSKDLSDAIDDLVIKQASNVDGTSGISIYFPYNNQMFYQYYGEKSIESISIGEEYSTFVESFATAWESDGQNVSDFYTELDTDEEESTEEETTEETTEESTEASTEEATEATTEETTEATTEELAEPVEDASSTDAEYIGSKKTLSVKLSKEQQKNMAQATYSVFMKNSSDDTTEAYLPIFTNIKIKPDENGELSVPYDPEILVASSYDGDTPWPFKQVEDNLAGKTIYRSNGQYLISSIKDFPDTSTEQVVCNVSMQDGEQPKILSFDAVSDSELVGKNDMTPEGWGYMAYYAPTYLPVTSVDGKMLPYSEWDRDGIFHMVYISLGENFTFATKKLSEIDAEFAVQITIKDVKGNVHATSLVDFTRNARTNTSIGTEEGKIDVSVFSDHVVVNSYEGTDTELVIPDSVQGVPVTAIGQEAFKNAGMTSVVIPEGVTNIGPEAFNRCENLETVELPSTVEYIGMDSFAYSEKLSSINLPEGLKTIDDFAFDQCSSLTEVTIPSTVDYYGPGAFAYTTKITMEGNENYQYLADSIFTADGKTLVQCFSTEENYSIPSGTEVIGAYSFRDNLDIKTVDIPEGVRLIDDGAFFQAENLSDIKLPDSVEEIGDSAFGCIVFTEKKKIDKISFGSKLTKLGNKVFRGFEVGSFEVSKDNQYFSTVDGYLTNKSKDGLILAPTTSDNEVKIPDGIISVYSDDFMSQNEGVEKVTLSDSVRVLNADSMYSVKELHIGKKLRFILSMNMMGSIQKLTINEKNKYFTIKDDVLYSHDMKELYIYPQEKKDKKFEVPEGVEKLEMGVFSDNTYMTSIKLPSTLKDVGQRVGSYEANALSEITTLTKITVSKKNKKYTSADGILYTKDGDEVVAIPAAIKGDVKIRSSAKIIGKGAVQSLKNINSITLPDGMTTIRSGNFYTVSGEVHIPESVNYISERSFIDAGEATIYGKKGSVAESFAQSKGLKFEEE